MSGAYPIAVLLEHLIQQHGPSKSEFVQSLGYRNIERGLRRLDLWLVSGQGHDRIIHQIEAVYSSEAAELNLAILDTNAMKAAEAESAFLEVCRAEADTFVPYVHAVGEKTVPEGITLFGLSGGHRRWTTVALPKDILDMPIEDQLARVPELMKGYLDEYKGACPFFGKLTGFRFVRLLDYFQFDKDGKVLEHVKTPFRPGYTFVFLR